MIIDRASALSRNVHVAGGSHGVSRVDPGSLPRVVNMKYCMPWTPF